MAPRSGEPTRKTRRWWEGAASGPSSTLGAQPAAERRQEGQGGWFGNKVRAGGWLSPPAPEGLPAGDRAGDPRGHQASLCQHIWCNCVSETCARPPRPWPGRPDGTWALPRHFGGQVMPWQGRACLQALPSCLLSLSEPQSSPEFHRVERGAHQETNAQSPEVYSGEDALWRWPRKAGVGDTDLLLPAPLEKVSGAPARLRESRPVGEGSGAGAYLPRASSCRSRSGASRKPTMGTAPGTTRPRGCP